MALLPVRERISRVVERWFIAEPLLFSTWSTHHLDSDSTVATIRVGHGRIRYNSAFIERLTERQLRALLAAEALRILLKHPYTRRMGDPRRAWAASNLTLGEYLRDPDLPFPLASTVFGTHDFDKKYMEFYYQRLAERAEGEGARELGAGAGAEGVADPSGETSGSPEPGSGGAEATPLDAHAAEGDNARDWEADELFTERIDDHIRAARDSARWGTVAGRLRDRILATLVPKLDYRAVLRHFRASILATTRVRTRMRPSRRYGFLYLGSRRDLTTRLLVAVDVSGSMRNDDIALGFSVVNRFFKYGIESIDVIQFDTAIQGEVLSLKRARRAVQVQGRGGTDFAPVIAYLNAHPGYDGLIVFTDGFAPAPPRPANSRTRLLWLFINEATWKAAHPALAKLGTSAFVKGE